MKPTLSEIQRLQCRIDELETWIGETAKELACTCDEAYTDRGRHAPECRAYLLSDCPANERRLSNCVFIGIDAGVDERDAHGLVIIGDGIRSMKQARTMSGLVFVGDRVVVGPKLFGQKNNLHSLVGGSDSEVDHV